MRKGNPSDIKREQFEVIRPPLERASKEPTVSEKEALAEAIKETESSDIESIAMMTTTKRSLFVFTLSALLMQSSFGRTVLKCKAILSPRS